MVFIRDTVINTDEFSRFPLTLMYPNDWFNVFDGSITPEGDFFVCHESSTDLNAALQWMEQQEHDSTVKSELRVVTDMMDEFYQRGEFNKA